MVLRGWFVWTVAAVLLLELVSPVFSGFESAGPGHHGGDRIAYSREFLLGLQCTVHAQTMPGMTSIDIENYCRGCTGRGEKNREKKKRGCRGGIRKRLKRRGCRKLPLPTITLTNARSLVNKMDELSALQKFDGDYKRSNLFCITETWLSEKNKDIKLDGFTLIRLDRDPEKTNKQLGGGVCMFVKDEWATHYTVRERVNTPSLEILTVSFRPFYLPREFGEVTVILTYVPGPDDKAAAERIAQSYSAALSRSVDQAVFICGDFNTCDLSSALPNLHQYVTCSTRLDNTLDKCFGDIPEAYTTRKHPPLGRSDHNVIHLLPTYRQKLKTAGPTVKHVKQWSVDKIAELQGCFEATDWQVFFDACGENEDDLTDTITSYIQFCENIVITTKQVKVYPNTKPWVTRDLKKCLQEKHGAFLAGDRTKVRHLTKQFQSEVTKAKLEYKNKVERKFKNTNARVAWQGLNTMMGRNTKGPQLHSDNPIALANELNKFYSRYDTCNYNSECDTACAGLSPEPVEVEVHAVTKCLLRINPNKAPGPDGLGGRVLKACARQLAPMFAQLFSGFLNLPCMPRMWKTSTIVPVPKKPGAKEMKDFRPVALTPIIAKCFERVVCNKLMLAAGDRLDPLQFAYRAQRGVEDATLTLLHLILQHLETSGATARVLFMDFSSAFNTLRHHVLLQRLIDLGIDHALVLWIRKFLSDRPQRVNIKGALSEVAILNTGVPQGCVLSPVLFSVYTNEKQINDASLTLVKYADDMALVCRLQGDFSLAQYRIQVQDLCNWFKDSFLELNVGKTKELVVFKKKGTEMPVPLFICRESVEIVPSFRYLGTIIDENMTFAEHTDMVFKKAQQRLYLLRKLRSFNISADILETVYRSLIESILTFNITSWFGHVGVKGKSKLNRAVNTASKVVGRAQLSLADLHQAALKRKANQIVGDCTHPLHCCFEKLPSGRRYRVPRARKNKFKLSFLPSAVTALNTKK